MAVRPPSARVRVLGWIAFAMAALLSLARRQLGPTNEAVDGDLLVAWRFALHCVVPAVLCAIGARAMWWRGAWRPACALVWGALAWFLADDLRDAAVFALLLALSARLPARVLRWTPWLFTVLAAAAIVGMSMSGARAGGRMHDLCEGLGDGLFMAVVAGLPAASVLRVLTREPTSEASAGVAAAAFQWCPAVVLPAISFALLAIGELDRRWVGALGSEQFLVSRDADWLWIVPREFLDTILIAVVIACSLLTANARSLFARALPLAAVLLVEAGQFSLHMRAVGRTGLDPEVLAYFSGLSLIRHGLRAVLLLAAMGLAWRFGRPVRAWIGALAACAFALLPTLYDAARFDPFSRFLWFSIEFGAPVLTMLAFAGLSLSRLPSRWTVLGGAFAFAAGPTVLWLLFPPPSGVRLAYLVVPAVAGALVGVLAVFARAGHGVCAVPSDHPIHADFLGRPDPGAARRGAAGDSAAPAGDSSP